MKVVLEHTGDGKCNEVEHFTTSVKKLKEHFPILSEIKEVAGTHHFRIKCYTVDGEVFSSPGLRIDLLRFQS